MNKRSYVVATVLIVALLMADGRRVGSGSGDVLKQYFIT